jgi:hypothetical protein
MSRGNIPRYLYGTPHDQTAQCLGFKKMNYNFSVEKYDGDLDARLGAEFIRQEN